MRIVFLTQYYPPEVGAPQTRISELVQRFLQRGHDVTVLTGMPSYPTGKVYAGYGGLVTRRRENGVTTIRTWLYPTQDAGMARRMANYFSFAASSGLFGSILLRKADFLFVESPPLFLGLSGLWLSRLLRARMIFNVSDLWPESGVHLGAISRDSHSYRAADKLEGFLYKRAWLVSGQSRTIVENIAIRFPGIATYHLSNGADTQRFHPDRDDPEVRRRLAPQGEFVVLYAGLHGLAQGLEQVLKAAQLLSTHTCCRFVFLGDGPRKTWLREEAVRLRLANVAFLDPAPSREMPAMIASADAVIIPLKTLIPGAVPSKLYESMASARPIIYVAPGEGADIVRRSNAGLVVRPGDLQGIADAVLMLMRDPALRTQLGSNGRRTAEDQFDRALIADRFINYLESGAGLNQSASRTRSPTGRTAQHTPSL